MLKQPPSCMVEDAALIQKDAEEETPFGGEISGQPDSEIHDYCSLNIESQTIGNQLSHEKALAGNTLSSSGAMLALMNQKRMEGMLDTPPTQERKELAALKVELELRIRHEREEMESRMKEEVETSVRQEREKMETRSKQEREEMEAKVEAMVSSFLVKEKAKDDMINEQPTLDKLTPLQSYNNRNQYPVIYCQQQGCLLVSSSHLCFLSNDGCISMDWEWNSLGRITTNRIMRIQHQDYKKVSLLFQFESQVALLAAASQFRQHIAKARRTITGGIDDSCTNIAARRNSYSEYAMDRNGLEGIDDLANSVMSLDRYPSDQIRNEFESLFASNDNVAGLMKRVEKLEEAQAYRAENIHKDIHKLVGAGNSDSTNPSVLPLKEQAPTPVQNVELTSLSSHSTDPPDGEIQWNEQEILNLVENRMEMKEAEDENWHSPFGETTYTFIYMSRSTSQSFWYAVSVYVLQVTTILLTLVDIVTIDELDAAENPFHIPSMVSPTVTCAQALTMFMLLANMSDLIEAVLKLQDGFYPEILEKHPGATFSTWLISCLAQLIAGLVLLGTSFILTMQSTTVIDLMLNLTALLFMAEIDDMAFFLAKMGFITNRLQAEAEAVAEFKVPKRKVRNRYRRMLYCLTLILLLAGYAAIKHTQTSGYFLPTNIYVQFGDAYNAKIPYYSGLLTSGNDWTLKHREYRHLGSEGHILLAYCRSIKAWTFSDEDDPCNYFARSLEIDTYDVTDIPDSDWEVLDSHGRLQPFDSFSLVSRDCNEINCQGDCGDDGLCTCHHERFGMDCEFTEVCPELIIDKRFKPFPSLKTSHHHGVGNRFHMLMDDKTREYVRVYNMPVYYSNQTHPPSIIFFGGRRWILTTESELVNTTQGQQNNPTTRFFPEETVAVFQNDFHGHHQASYAPFYISDPVDFETPYFQATPTGINWWTVTKGNETARDYSPDAPLDTHLVCKEKGQSCLGQPEDFCVFGECNKESGLCDCHKNYEGYSCHLAKPCYKSASTCNGHGICDEGSGHCRCNLPYFGASCEARYKCYEEGGRCQNGGLCDEVSGECSCPEDPAITGYACEIQADCYIFGCANGGQCTWNGQCVCRPPFYGAHCDLVDYPTQEEGEEEESERYFCKSNKDCLNGTCSLDTGICDCDDPTSYGTRCEHTYDCSEVPSVWGDVTCLNSGTCNDSTGVCDCPKPFYGPDCSKVAPCISDDDCGSSGEDDGHHHSYCDVETGLCGPCADVRSFENRCDPVGECRTQADCHNGGLCNGAYMCVCQNGYGSTFCDALVSGRYNERWDDHMEEVQSNVTRCGFDDPGCSICEESEEDPPLHCYDGDP